MMRDATVPPFIGTQLVTRIVLPLRLADASQKVTIHNDVMEIQFQISSTLVIPCSTFPHGSRQFGKVGQKRHGRRRDGCVKEIHGDFRFVLWQMPGEFGQNNASIASQRVLDGFGIGLLQDDAWNRNVGTRAVVGDDGEFFEALVNVIFVVRTVGFPTETGIVGNQHGTGTQLLRAPDLFDKGTIAAIDEHDEGMNELSGFVVRRQVTESTVVVIVDDTFGQVAGRRPKVKVLAELGQGVGISGFGMKGGGDLNVHQAGGVLGKAGGGGRG
mmetsp:Transcript_59959/g.90390  ORF Transcript_59959/g.90390 Transcript_59959/m.90390 type:complete len:271 (+) Transcript_59959:441-1253(+)